jgi:hypothetical protein
VAGWAPQGIITRWPWWVMLAKSTRKGAVRSDVLVGDRLGVTPLEPGVACAPGGPLAEPSAPLQWLWPPALVRRRICRVRLRVPVASATMSQRATCIATYSCLIPSGCLLDYITGFQLE